MLRPPKYSELELQNILESSQALPDSIPESVYEKRIRDNSKLKWCINPFLARENKLNLFLGPAVVKKWLLLKRLNWVIAFLIVVLSTVIKDYILCFIFSLQYWLAFSGHLFLYMVIIILVTYILSKITYLFLEKNILKMAFSDPNTFWKFYSNKFIYIDATKLDNDFQKLVADYPEMDR
jgi:hypothetical protein